MDYERRLASQPVRPIHEWERAVLKALADRAGLPAKLTDGNALDTHRVREMLDGGMGSIRFVTSDEDRRGARFSVAELQYQDSDGVPVSFALNLDVKNEPWEVDAFRADGSPLRRPPLDSDTRT